LAADTEKAGRLVRHLSLCRFSAMFDGGFYHIDKAAVCQ
jgi:hypothetical protein